jgi:hypothetical protein
MKNENTEKCALVLVSMPDNTPGTVTQNTWLTFLESLKGTELERGNKMQIHQNMWLIPLHSGLLLLTTLIRQAQVNGILTRVLFLDETPNWITVPAATKSAA